MNFFEWLTSLRSPKVVLPPNNFTGVLDDPRPVEKKREDYKHEERLFAGAPDPFANGQLASSPFQYENQNQTGSCVPHGVGLALAIERKLDGNEYARLAPMFPYRLRSNFPQAGSYMPEMFNSYAKLGAPLYFTLPTPADEAAANKLSLTGQMYTEGEIFKGKEFYTLNIPNDIQAIASIASAGHGVPILIYAEYSEWATNYPTIKYPNLRAQDAGIRHCICVLPNSGFWLNNRRYVVIQDSSWFGGYKMRYISEDFLKARCYGAGYWDTVEIIGSGAPPHYTFTKVLKYGSVGPEVKAMQQLLVSEGLLPTDCITGNFYGRTLAGVRAFQNKYASEILAPLGLDAPTDTWGSMSIAKANKICSQ